MPSPLALISLVLGSFLGSPPGLAHQPGAPADAPADLPAKDAAPSAPEGRAAESGTLTNEERQDVLDDVERALKRRAFVVGVDFDAWPDRLAEVHDRLLEADEPGELVSVVNRALAKFGISHLRLNPPSRKPAPSTPGSRQPSRQPGSQPRSSANQTLTWLDGDIAVIKIRSFDDELYERPKIEAFFDELAPRAKGLILDLRGNGGGAVSALSHLLSLFLPEGTEVGVYVNKEVTRAFERAKGEKASDPVEVAAWTHRKFRVRRNPKPPIHLPTAVLLSRGSASASEIVAAALRDHANAAIVGQPSAGKVLLSMHSKLAHGFELQIPTADYVTAKGRRLEGQPLRPNLPAPGGRGAPSEAALNLAADLLRNGL